MNCSLLERTVRFCKIYIHDLSVKKEIAVRQQLLMSGTTKATQIRFVQDLHEADVWILAENSVFVAYAKKYQRAHGLRIWQCQEPHLIDLSSDERTILSNAHIADFVDSFVTGKKSIKFARTMTLQDAPNMEVLQQLCQGMQRRSGELCLLYKSAVIHFDFASFRTRYNQAGHDLLWGESFSVIKLAKLTRLQQTPMTLLMQGCSAFAAIWQLMTRSDMQNLLAPMTMQTAIKLQAWPAFEQVPHDFEHLRIASLIQKRALSAEQIKTLLLADERFIYGLFNALYVCHVLVLEEKPVQAINIVVEKTGRLTNLWRKVRQAVTQTA